MSYNPDKNRFIITKAQIVKDKHFRFIIKDDDNIILETYHIWWPIK